jgi:hypothetical protein
MTRYVSKEKKELRRGRKYLHCLCRITPLQSLLLLLSLLLLVLPLLLLSLRDSRQANASRLGVCRAEHDAAARRHSLEICATLCFRWR